MPLFGAVIMQSGFCDDMQDAWHAGQSEELFVPMSINCKARGKAFVACFSDSDVAYILSLGGDTLACCNHWAQPRSHCHVASQSEVNARVPPKSFWPWGVCSGDSFDSSNEMRSIGHMPVTLSLGDGARGELELLTCAYQASSMFLARTEFHIGVLSVCALGCGEALKDGGSGICCHADEVPCILVSWLNVAFTVRIRLWRSCHLIKKGRSRRLLLRAKCGKGLHSNASLLRALFSSTLSP